MANALINADIIAKEALLQLKNNVVMGSLVSRDKITDEFDGSKVGQTVRVRRPVKFAATAGAVQTIQDVLENTLPVTLSGRYHVSWAFSSQELTLTIEEYSERYIKPAVISLVNQVDADLCGLYNKVWNWVGTPGQVIDSFADFAKMPQRLDDGAVPQSMRNAILTPADNWAMLGSQTGLFVNNIAEPAYKRGKLPMIGNIDAYNNQNVRTHTVGPLGGAPLINGGAQAIAYSALAANTYQQNLVTDGWTAAAAVRLNAGDVFTITGVFAVNPVSKATLPFLQQFVSLNQISSDGAGNATIVISPPIITSGAYQTVSAAPADNVAITVLGSANTGYPQNMSFHKSAFMLAFVPLIMPDSVVFKSRASDDGYSIRVIKDWDQVNDRESIRLDILYGVAAVYPELATRGSGT